MSFTPTAVTLATAGTLTVRELPMPPWTYGAIAFASFLVLLGVLWTFRNTAARYDTPVRVQHDDRRGPGDPHGSQGSTDPGAHH
jgi:hypothetical protein